MRARLWYGLLTFALASVLNPGYFVGCAVSTDDAPKFQYGAEEMTEFALAANDSYEFVLDSVEYWVEVDIEPERAMSARAALSPAGSSPFALIAHACGDRRLFSTASACIDSSSMRVSGTITLLRTREGSVEEVVANDVPVNGTLTVYSLVLSQGSLDLQFDGGRLGLNGVYRDSFALSSYQIQSLLAATL